MAEAGLVQKQKHVLSEISLRSVFIIKRNLEKIKYNYFRIFVFRDTDHTVGDNYLAHFL